MPYDPFFEEDIDVLIEEEVTDDTGTGEVSQLIVYNDEVNSFDWVIKCFEEVLRHTSEQAEQLSVIIHTKGKATVKTAPLGELRPKKDALIDRGLSAVIED
ncbi:MAG: ATP-dependent Clp protease adaptor ClpS [Bacteroidetes bacterium]|nr:ATP-dependent Clp protease adaptor ClpS [Bacteroidota bacterium]